MELSIMTFNLRFGLADDGENGWGYREPLVARLLERHPADIIGFQEANHFQMEFLAVTLANHGFIGWHNKKNERWQSNPIFHHSTWTCVDHRHRFLSETPETESRLPGSQWPRQCVTGVFEKGGRQVVVANTHFDFDEAVQRRSTELVLEFLKDYPAAVPHIITGDFNAQPGSAAYRRFDEAGFTEVLDGEPVTTHHGFSCRPTGSHIDWILFRGDLAKSESAVFTDSFDGRCPSDHYPVRAVFHLR
jgi:endonuclease/exonuclease/phosphatase family metal-dependent hydrolase